MKVGKVFPTPVRFLFVNDWLSEVPTMVPLGAVSEVPHPEPVETVMPLPGYAPAARAPSVGLF